LVELSIVLIIIGLILGGILVGQDLIRNAQVNATANQIQQLNASVNAFRGKYNALPGDINRAVAFNLEGACPDGDVCEGDGDGTLENDIAVNGTIATLWDQEIKLFWVHLSEAGLAGGNFSYDDTDVAVVTNYPQAKNKANGIIAVTLGSVLHWIIAANIDSTSADEFTGGGGNISGADGSGGMPPSDAFGIDTKIDNGNSITGGVYAIASIIQENTDPSTTITDVTISGSKIQRDEPVASPSVTECSIIVASGTTSEGVEYNLAEDANLCVLAVKAST
jgi:outer membrane murein-binding lipoprotein Lpp